MRRTDARALSAEGILVRLRHRHGSASKRPTSRRGEATDLYQEIKELYADRGAWQLSAGAACRTSNAREAAVRGEARHGQACATTVQDTQGARSRSKRRSKAILALENTKPIQTRSRASRHSEHEVQVEKQLARGQLGAQRSVRRTQPESRDHRAGAELRSKQRVEGGQEQRARLRATSFSRQLDDVTNGIGPTTPQARRSASTSRRASRRTVRRPAEIPQGRRDFIKKMELQNGEGRFKHDAREVRQRHRSTNGQDGKTSVHARPTSSPTNSKAWSRPRPAASRCASIFRRKAKWSTSRVFGAEGGCTVSAIHSGAAVGSWRARDPVFVLGFIIALRCQPLR